MFKVDMMNKYNRHTKLSMQSMQGLFNNKEKLYLTNQNKLDLKSNGSGSEVGGQ